MGRIFEALQKTGNAFGSEDMKLLTELAADDVVETAAGQGYEQSANNGAPRRAVTIGRESTATEVAVVAERTQSEARGEPNTAEPQPITWDQVRMVPLHVAAATPILPFDRGSARVIEQYRIIRTKIHQHPRRPKVVGVTSAGAGDGKTVTSVNIAGAISLKAGARVLLVEADFRRSVIATVLGTPAQPGLSDVLMGRCAFEDAACRLQDFPNCYVLPAGAPVSNPPELLDSQSWRDLCLRMRAAFDHVIVDTPPVGVVADSDLIYESCDSIVFVVRPDHTVRSSLTKALGLISREKIIGMVLNDVTEWFLWKGQGKYSYDYTQLVDMKQNRT